MKTKIQKRIMKKRKGFTLIEMVIVITIIGILSSIAVTKQDLRRMLDEDFHYRLAMRLYSGSIRQAGTEEKVAVQNKVERPAIKLETVSRCV